MEKAFSWKRLEWNLFLDSFFSGGYLFLLFFLLLIWGLSNAYTRDILAMQSYISDLELGGFIQLRSERINARRQIANAYLAIGLVLIILVSLARLDLSLYEEVVGKALSMPLGISVIPLVIYFLAGLILLSLSQFAILRGGWLMGNVPIAPKVAANWLRYSIIIFGIAGIGIYFLPTDYSINLLQSALFVIQFLFDVILFLMGLFIFPFVYIYSLILSLLGKTPAQDSQPQMPDFELPPDKTPPGVLPPWLELVKNILFWTILSGGMIYFIWHYMRQNKSWLAGLKWQGFSNWVASLRKWFHQLFPTIQRQIENFINELGANFKGTKKYAKRENGSRKNNLKKLNSKEKILYFYVSFLEEMDNTGDW